MFTFFTLWKLAYFSTYPISVLEISTGFISSVVTKPDNCWMKSSCWKKGSWEELQTEQQNCKFTAAFSLHRHCFPRSCVMLTIFEEEILHRFCFTLNKYCQVDKMMEIMRFNRRNNLKSIEVFNIKERCSKRLKNANDTLGKRDKKETDSL